MDIGDVKAFLSQVEDVLTATTELKDQLNWLVEFMGRNNVESLEEPDYQCKEMEERYEKLENELETTKEALKSKESLTEERRVMADILQGVLDSSNGNLKNEIEKFISVLGRPDIPLNNKSAVLTHMT